VHIVWALSYAVLGAFQFSTAPQRRRPGWHRVAGRVLVVLGLAVALSALWMTQFYPRQPGTGGLTYVFRLAFAPACHQPRRRGVHHPSTEDPPRAPQQPGPLPRDSSRRPVAMDGNLGGDTRAQTGAVLWVAIVIIAIPWRHVYAQYVAAPGDTVRAAADKDR